MEKQVSLQIERLPEGGYLATSNEVQGLVVQGRTIEETLEISRDVAKKLLEAQETLPANLTDFAQVFAYPLVVGF